MLPKNQFLEKSDALTKNFQTIAGTWIHLFLPTLAEIGEAEETTRVRGIHHKKGWYFAPLITRQFIRRRNIHMKSLQRRLKQSH